MRLWHYLLALTGVLVIGAAAWFTRGYWLRTTAGSAGDSHQAVAFTEPRVLKLSPQARGNLGLVSKPVKPQTYWRTIQVPGMVVDRPGQSDRGVSAPAAGVVARIHAYPGDTVKSGQRLATLRLTSEYLQSAQTELFKAAREIQLVQEQRDRLAGAVKSGAVAETRLIELDNQLRRLTAALQAYRQDLLNRGLNLAQVDSVMEGKFVTAIDVSAPLTTDALLEAKPPEAEPSDLAYEVHKLEVELGQQVQAGQMLCLLANHRSLYIEGHGFKREAPALEQAARHGWPVQVEFAEDDSKLWPALKTPFHIRHLANTVDAASRTFSFFIPLSNQSRSYEKDGKIFLVWRFRPGQRVRLHVPVEQFGKEDAKEEEKVFVLPAAAVVRDGPDAYVFEQNGDLFQRRPVHVVHEDRFNIVLANDGSIKPGMYLAQGAAASLNRVLKAQNASGGLPPGAHFHADGTLHIPGKE